MLRGLLIAAALTGCAASPDVPVPEEIVFDVCRSGWPDWPNKSAEEAERDFVRAADMWALSPTERDYVATECAQMGKKINDRIQKMSFNMETFKPQRTFPERLE